MTNREQITFNCELDKCFSTKLDIKDDLITVMRNNRCYCFTQKELSSYYNKNVKKDTIEYIHSRNPYILPSIIDDMDNYIYQTYNKEVSKNRKILEDIRNNKISCENLPDYDIYYILYETINDKYMHIKQKLELINKIKKCYKEDFNFDYNNGKLLSIAITNGKIELVLALLTKDLYHPAKIHTKLDRDTALMLLNENINLNTTVNESLIRYAFTWNDETRKEWTYGSVIRD